MNKEKRGARTTGVSLRVWIALIVLCLVNVAAHLIVMPSLPAQIPTHWGADGSVNGWGPRWMASAHGALPLAFLAMFYVVPRIDPKGEAYRTSGKFYQGFVIAFTLIMCAIGWLCELTVWASSCSRRGECGSFHCYRPFVRGHWQLLAAHQAKLHDGCEDALGACRPR